jgi:hypothetical protein
MPVHINPTDEPSTPEILTTTPTHVTVVWEIPRAELKRYVRFMERLLVAAQEPLA